MDVRIIGRHRLHDRRLSKADANHQVIAALGKRAHRRFNGGRIARLNIAQDDIHCRLVFSFFVFARLPVGCLTCLGAFHSNPCGRIERAIVLAADVKDNPHVNLLRIVGAVTHPMAGDAAKNQQPDHS